MTRHSRWLAALSVVVACSRTPDGQPATKAAETATPAATAPAPDTRYSTEALGALRLTFTEGTPAARAHYTRGMLALHSFWYDEATHQFESAIAADPKMNVAYLGLALSHCKLLWGEDDVGASLAAIKAMPDPNALSNRDKLWLLAVLELVKAQDVPSGHAALVAGLEKVHRAFPDDESATFLAIALLSTIRPGSPDQDDVRRRAIALASVVYKDNPKHPGAAHYLIHAYDTPALASEALPYARAYAQIAPEAFHARHMPAHIFSQLGMWNDAIVSCQAAWEASVAAAAQRKLSANHHDFHSLNWLVEMPFELGQRSKADAALKIFADAVRAGVGRQHRAVYASQVASYMARTGEWNRVEELLAPLASEPREDAAPADARAGMPAASCAPAVAAEPAAQFEQIAILDTRARAAAMQRDVAATKKLIAEADAVRTKLRPFFEATQPPDTLAYFDAADDRRRKTMLARAAGDDRALLALLRASVAAPSMEVGERNPSAFLAEEELADTLARMGKHAEAAAAYGTVLKQYPRRAHSLLGRARAATAARDTKTARAAYQQLVELWAAADATTPGLDEARKALATP